MVVFARDRGRLGPNYIRKYIAKSDGHGSLFISREMSEEISLKIGENVAASLYYG